MPNNYPPSNIYLMDLIEGAGSGKKNNCVDVWDPKIIYSDGWDWDTWNIISNRKMKSKLWQGICRLNSWRHAQNHYSGLGEERRQRGREDKSLYESDLDCSKIYLVKIFRGAMEEMTVLSSLSAPQMPGNLFRAQQDFALKHSREGKAGRWGFPGPESPWH